MKDFKIINIFSIILLVFALLSSWFIEYYAFDKRMVTIDQIQHFHDMKKMYESKIFPVVGTRFIANRIVDDYYTTPHVPGGIYYIFYTLFYKLSGESFLGARFLNLIFSLFIVYVFLIWVYKRFDLLICSLISALLLTNGYLVLAVTDFWNPNITLLFSFLFFIFLFEYIDEKDEIDKRKNIIKLSAVIIFPILAVMAQGHFVTFFSMIPTLIVYLILTYKRTIKYILFWGIGVFISFLEYLPYIISEINSGFSNINKIFSLRSGFKSFGFPQIHSIFMYPTNEMSSFYGSGIRAIINFWIEEPMYLYGILFLFLSLLFLLTSFIISIYFLIRKKENIKNDNLKVLFVMFKIYLLFIPVTIIVYLASRSLNGSFHYLYSAFSMSFLPFFIFFMINENNIKNNKKILIAVFLLLFMNVISMIGQLTRYFDGYENQYNYKDMLTISKLISNDADNNTIKIINLYRFAGHPYMLRDFALTYKPEYVWKQSDDSDNVYILFDKSGALRHDKNSIMENIDYLNTNSYIIFTNKSLILYKFTNDNLNIPNKF